MPCHALSFLAHADWIVSIHAGEVVEQGSYQGLLAKEGGDFAELMASHASVVVSEGKLTGETAAAAKVGGGDDGADDNGDDDDESGIGTTLLAGAASRSCAGQGKSGKMMQVEERAKGTVANSVFLYYIAQVGKALVTTVLLLYIVGNCVRIFRDYWISRWAVHDLGLVVGYSADSWDDDDVVYYFLSIYATLGMIIILFTGTRTIIIQVIGLSAARKLHNKMLWRLLKAPVSFFDQTPVGRIVNRFTSDFNTIDRQISDNFVGVARAMLDLVTSFGVIIVVLPFFILRIGPMLLIYWRIQSRYRKTARELKRLSSNARSPIFQHFNVRHILICVHLYTPSRRVPSVVPAVSCENITTHCFRCDRKRSTASQQSVPLVRQSASKTSVTTTPTSSCAPSCVRQRSAAGSR
jgi:ABC-type multidrug transport system fused ATPase/permease subunit